MFDFLSYVKELETGGFQRTQAESQVGVMTRMLNENFATREGIADAKLELRQDFSKLRDEFGAVKADFANLRGEFGNLRGEFGELRGEFKAVRADFSKLSNDVKHIENQLLLKLGGLMIGLFTIGSGIISYVIKSH